MKRLFLFLLLFFSYCTLQSQNYKAFSWGRGEFGQIGNGTTTAYNWNPTQIGSSANWKTADNGYQHTAAIKSDGTLWIWGDNYFGQLGDGTTGNIRTTPSQLGSGTDWVSIACGSWSNLAIKSDGAL